MSVEGPRVEGLRARNKRATRDRIVTAALELFDGSGYAATTVDAIAAASGVSPRTFFHYFPTKQDVLLGHEHELLTCLIADVAAAPPEQSPADALWDAIEQMAKRFDAARDTLRPLYALIVSEPSVHRRSLELQIEWEHDLANELASRMSGPSRDERSYLMAAAALACLRSSARRWAEQPTARSRSLLRMVRAARGWLPNDLQLSQEHR